MEQTGMDSDILYLPQEIIRNILKRLPVKSLIRFQCVCKDWKNLIQNPSFIADHLQQSSHQNPSLLFEYSPRKIPLRRRLRLPDCGLQVREVQKAPSIDYLEDARIVGSCNGLLLVEQYKKSPPLLSLWNHATTAVRHVPITRTDCFDFTNCVTGFGFSPIDNEYRIVRTYGRPVSGGEVFLLSGESWKGIDVGNLKRVRLSYENVTVNGTIFWTGVKLGAEEEDEDDVDVIVSYDMVNEVFTLIPWPNLDHIADVKLTVYENKLAILCDIWEIGHLIVWVLDEDTCADGEKWSWTKRYTGSSLSCTLGPVTIWRNEIVCKFYPEEDYERGRQVLFLMNLTTNEVRRFVISYCGPVYRIYYNVESLVPVGNNHIE